MLPPDFSFSHGLAVLLLFVSWFSYASLLAAFGRSSLNSQLAVVRMQWLRETTKRPAKPFDAVLLGHIVNSIAFFGSATLLVLAGLISTYASLKSIHETFTQLHFVTPASLELFALNIGCVALVVALCFFSFTYSLRKLIYAIALIGALPDASEKCPTHDEMVGAASVVLSESIRTFNFGIRGYYYAVASLGLFLSPYASILATFFATGVLLYRQLATPTTRAIQDYVEAAKSRQE